MAEPILYPRFVRCRLEEALEDTPVVLVHGPRQCGKTTLARLVGEAAGYDYIKIYNNTPRAAYQGIIDQAQLEGMAILGHFPNAVGSATALADGMAMVSHAK